MTDPDPGEPSGEGSNGRTDLIGGLALIAAALTAVIVANSPLSGLYDRLLDTPVEVRIGAAGLQKPLLLWINDGLMAVFFLLVGVELKREVLEGELQRLRDVLLPLGAAVGGVLVPIGIYLAFNAGSPARLEGWAIPAATDIAFAIGVLALLGSRVPGPLRTFLLSLAVFDDIIAIVIIAVAYAHDISWVAQGVAAGLAAVMYGMNRLGVTRYGLYFLVGAALWVCVLKSGVHATLAGVVIGLMIPRRPRNALGHAPLHQVEHVLRPWVYFLILPLFAFVNAGVSLEGFGVARLTDTVTLGVGVGLVVGKTTGVFTAALALHKSGVARFAEGTRTVHYLGVAALAGIGFTMSLFIGVLAFEEVPRSFDAPVRIGVLGGSTIAALLGLTLLWLFLPRGAPGTDAQDRPPASSGPPSDRLRP